MIVLTTLVICLLVLALAGTLDAKLEKRRDRRAMREYRRTPPDERARW